MEKFRVLKQSHSVDWFIPLVACLAFALPTLGIFNYFILDDFYLLYNSYLNSESLIDLFKAAFSGQMDALAYYRPLPSFFWGLGYRMWGMNPIGYQLMISLLFSIIAVYLYKIGRLLKGRIVGLIASLSFLTFFPNFESTWYKGAAWCGILTASFLIIGIFDGILWLKEEKKKYLILCLMMTILASLCKETSLLFGPIIMAYALLCHSDNNRKRGILLGVLTGVVTIAILLLAQCLTGFSLRPRVLLPNILIMFSVLKSHIHTYIFYFGIPLLYLITLGFARRWRYHIIILPLILIILVSHSKFYPLFLVLISMCFFLGSPQQRFAIAWFFIGLSYTLTGLYYPNQPHRFMLESSLGMALLIGLSIEDYVSKFKIDFINRINFLRNMKDNLKDWRSFKMLKFLSFAIGVVTALVLLLVGAYHIIRIDIISGRVSLGNHRAMTQNIKDISFYVREYIPHEAIKLVRPECGLDPSYLAWICQIHYDSAVTGVKFNIDHFGCQPAENKKKVISYLINNREIYVIGPLSYLFEFIALNRFWSSPSSVERKDLGLNVYGSNKIQVRVTEKDAAINFPDAKSNILRAETGEPCYTIVEFKGDGLLKSLTILASPRLYNDPQMKTYIDVSYSRDGNGYLPVFRFSSTGDGGWTPIMRNTVCRTILPHSEKVYLRFQFHGSGQLWIPTIIVNGIKGTPVILSFSPETGADEPIVATAHIEKVFGTDGTFAMGVLKIEKMSKGN